LYQQISIDTSPIKNVYINVDEYSHKENYRNEFLRNLSNLSTQNHENHLLSALDIQILDVNSYKH